MNKSGFNLILFVAMGIAVAGLIFKLLHWPGANLLLIAGFGSMAVYGAVKTASEQSLSSRLGSAAITFLALGFLFKMMHWPYAQIMLGIALIAGLGSILLTNKDDSAEL
jgi:hypothetical protein